jgi:hypothetical protein
MASDVIFSLRTVTRAFIGRQVSIPNTTPGLPPIRFLVPIPETIPPESLTISPGEDFGEIPGRSLSGEKRIEFTYTDGRKPEISLAYGAASPDIDTLLTGKIMTSVPNYNGFVYFEVVGSQTIFPAKTAGKSGFGVLAQTAASTADIYYIDPANKLVQSVAVVADTPVGDQIAIGANMALTLSPELGSSDYLIRGWVPCVYSKATIMTAQSMDLVTVRCEGVTYGGDVVGMFARNCTRFQSGEIGTATKAVKLRINPDAADGTGLGFQLFYTNESVN